MLLTNRSACPFKFGLRGGNRTDFTPIALENRQKLCCGQRVSIMNEIAIPFENAIKGSVTFRLVFKPNRPYLGARYKMNAPAVLRFVWKERFCSCEQALHPVRYSPITS
jgi:hypothetical protein